MVMAIDSLTLTLPKARARRRRLPRPPKLTPDQKMRIAAFAFFFAMDLIVYLSDAAVWALVEMAANGCGIQAVLLEARGRLWESAVASRLCIVVALGGLPFAIAADV